MSWTRTSKKGFKGTTPNSRFKKSVGTSIFSTTLHVEHSSQIADKTRAPGAFLFYFMDDVYFNSTYSSGSNFRTDEISEWFRDYDSTTNVVPDDDPYEGDADSDGMSLLLSADQKTFFADILDDADDIFDFEGNNGDGGTTLIDSDGFLISAGLTFVVNPATGNGEITSSNTSIGSACYLPIQTEIGESYQAGVELVAGTSGGALMGMGVQDSYVISYHLMTNVLVTGPFVTDTFTATAETSFLHLSLFRSTVGIQIDNLWINKVTTI